MDSREPCIKSTKETANYARLCRLLIDVGGQALRDEFNAHIAPKVLERVLKRFKPYLEHLRVQRILSSTQWDSLYPLIPSTVSSEKFDITTLCVLLRNVCNVTCCKSYPDDTNRSLGADIFRIEYFRNAIYAHVTKTSIDDASFRSYWSDIREVILRIGGRQYEAAITELETVCMDPELEESRIELFKRWKKDDNISIEKLDRLNEKTENWCEGVIDLKDRVAAFAENCSRDLRKLKDQVNASEGEHNSEHIQATNQSPQEDEIHGMKSGKLSLANSTDKPVREVKQNDTEPPVKVVQALGEEGENEIRILAKCPDLNSLQSLWEDYRSGHLNTALERLLLTDDIKEKFGVESISINTTILEKDYQACREYLSENIRFGRNSEAEKEMARAAECAKKLEKEEKEEEKDWMDI